VPTLEGSSKIYESGEASIHCAVDIEIPYEYFEDEAVRIEWGPRLDYHLIFSLTPIDSLDSSYWVKDISVNTIWMGPVDVINLMDGGDDIYIRAFYMHEENHTYGSFSNQLHYNLQTHYAFTMEDYYAFQEEENNPTTTTTSTTATSPPDNSHDTQPPTSNPSDNTHSPRSDFFSDQWWYVKLFGIIGLIFFVIILYSTYFKSKNNISVSSYNLREIKVGSSNNRSNRPHYHHHQHKIRSHRGPTYHPQKIRRNTRKIEQNFETIIQKIDEKYLRMLPAAIRKTNNIIKIRPQEFESRTLLCETILSQLQSSEKWKEKLLDIYLEWQSKVKSKDWRFA
jgi:hypothetical protein